MTGEVTLTGKVLPVGGIKEKVMAARRANVRVIVMPAANRKDYEELPSHLTSGLTAHFAASYAEDVYPIAFEYSASVREEERERMAAAHPSQLPAPAGGAVAAVASWPSSTSTKARRF